MTTAPHIRYCKRQEIDITRWDDLVRQTPNGLIYARSFFLDGITDGQWDALVLDDYKAVMPLTWNKKFGIAYLHQPVYAAMLGVFGDPAEYTLPAFLKAIPPRFRLWDLDLNEGNNLLPDTGLRIKRTTRLNYFIPLDKSYEDLRKDYKRLARRMTQKAAESGLGIVRDTPPAEIIEHYRKAYGRRLAHIPAAHFRRLATCATTAFATGHAATYLARRPDNTIAAFYLVFSDHRFVYSTLGGSTDSGKEEGAFYLLTDAVLRDHCNTPRSFRFEGSDNRGIAFFNAQFGPYPVNYPHLLLNKLPFPLNLLKPR